MIRKSTLLFLSALIVAAMAALFFQTKNSPCLFPVYSNSIPLLKDRSPLDAAIVKLDGKHYLILAYKTGPESSYSSTPVFFYPLSEEGKITGEALSFGETEHVRQISKIQTPWGEGVLFADHGKDGGSYDGGKILLIVHDRANGTLTDKSAQLKQERNFSFNAVAVKRNSVADDILITPYNGPKSKVVFLQATEQGYTDKSELLPEEWRKFQHCFMTAQPVDVNGDGVDEVALGGCDQTTSHHPDPRDRLLIFQNGHWEFAAEQTFPLRKREATWGTVYWLKEKSELFALTHNKGFTKADVQGLIYSPRQKSFQDKAVQLDSGREKVNHYIHKMIRFKDLYLGLIRYGLPQQNSLSLMALTKDSQGILRETTVCLKGPAKEPVLGLETLTDGQGREQLALIYYSGRLEIYQ